MLSTRPFLNVMSKTGLMNEKLQYTSSSLGFQPLRRDWYPRLGLPTPNRTLQFIIEVVLTVLLKVSSNDSDGPQVFNEPLQLVLQFLQFVCYIPIRRHFCYSDPGRQDKPRAALTEQVLSRDFTRALDV